MPCAERGGISGGLRVWRDIGWKRRVSETQLGWVWVGSYRASWSLGEGMVHRWGLLLVGAVCCSLLPPVGLEREEEDGG